MEYNVYLQYKTQLDLNLNDYFGGIYEHIFADIMYELDEVAEDEEDDEVKSSKIGFMSWVECNQVLARAYGVSMTEIPYLSMRTNSNALMNIDRALITQETIDEIGATTNPNIIVLIDFGISDAWKNKGIGEQVLKGIIKQMKGKYGYFMVLNSVPAQFGEYADPDSKYEREGVELAGLEKDPEKAQWKLNAFWQRCGFRQFKNYDNVFVCNIDQAVPELIITKRPEIRFS